MVGEGRGGGGKTSGRKRKNLTCLRQAGAERAGESDNRNDVEQKSQCGDEQERKQIPRRKDGLGMRHALWGATGSEELAEDVLKDAAVLVIGDFLWSIDAGDGLE